MYKKQGQGSSLTWKKCPAPSLMAMLFQRLLYCIYRQTHTPDFSEMSSVLLQLERNRKAARLISPDLGPCFDAIAHRAGPGTVA